MISRQALRSTRKSPVRVAGYILPLLVLPVIAVISAPTWIKNLAIDDALYYPTVARNIASGLGSTYDGFTQTNGYHPLWCWLQVPIAAATGSLSNMTYLWFVKILIVVVVGMALVVWGQLILRVTGSNWMSATFVLLLGGYWWSVHTLYSGMETPLVVLLMGVSLLLAHRVLENHSVATAVALGSAMAGTFLARLDSIFFLGVLGCVLLIALRRQFRLQLAWILPAVLLPLPYLWWNISVFGNAIPVSGIRKSTSSLDFLQQFSILSRFVSEKLSKLVTVLHPIGVVIAFAFVLLFAVAILLVRREFRQQAGRLNILWALPVGALLHFAYIAIFMVEVTVSWYQYAEYLTIFLTVSLAVAAGVSWIQSRDTNQRLQWTPFAVVFAAVLAALAAFAPKAMPDVANVRSYDAAVWAREHLSSNEPRFGMYDPGVFRFVSGFQTMALNGLASTRSVTTLVQQEKWSEIISRYDIRYVVEFVADEDISAIPPQYIRYRSEPYKKYEWRYSRQKVGSLLILDSSYPGMDSLI